MSWISEHLAPLMFGGMVLFMLVGYPAAFSLAATGLFFGFIGIPYSIVSRTPPYFYEGPNNSGGEQS